MFMPKTPIDQNDGFVLGKNQIRRAGQSGIVQSVSKTQPMKFFSNNQFRFCKQLEKPDAKLLPVLIPNRLIHSPYTVMFSAIRLAAGCGAKQIITLGFDLTQKIFNETKGSIPVVIVTGLYKGPQYKNEALRSFGAADYFEKPYDQNKLLSSVLNLLQDEIVIEEDLPDPAAVLDLVSQLNSSGAASKKQRS